MSQSIFFAFSNRRHRISTQLIFNFYIYTVLESKFGIIRMHFKTSIVFFNNIAANDVFFPQTIFLLLLFTSKMGQSFVGHSVLKHI